ncbi:glycoside hydrolase family 16 protein [Salinibacterium sp. UTAS2018]|uniref:glycoside hydrolase family 16 protein n=1 Tax=Salinibacterium sp. UTAS2018 TaxID=2508880 RepID=UPI00100975CD|nr:glycoside hydrolase family 16 protein [Salinibacterium sp. UTAS2018]QAV71043.1 glycoside hydrolase family 16 protein [Salinibacterium sp. UTAS2018]
MNRKRVTPLAITLLAVALLLSVLLVSQIGDSASGPPVASDEPNDLASPPPDPQLPGRSLVWSDEFDGPAGSAPNPDNWTNEVGGEGWGNNELQFYTEGVANAALDGTGNLVITARALDPLASDQSCWYGPCSFTSARLISADKVTVEFGRVEARIQVPGAGGVWPAFWMLGEDLSEVDWPEAGEIDVMEFVGNSPTQIFGTIHGPGYSGEQSFGGVLGLGTPVADEWHEVAVEWSPGRIVWEVDGTVYHEAVPADVAPNSWVFDQPFFLLVNLAVGGDFGGDLSDDITQPQEYRLDYIRAYELSA